MEYFQTKFGVCFSIKITHPYFDDGVCPYLSIEPDALTKRLLTQCRFITKVSAGYAKIIATASGEIENGEATKIENLLGEKHHFTFLIKVKDRAFFNIVNEDLKGFPNEILYFSNNLKSTKLSSRKCLVVNDRLLRIRFDEGKIPNKIKISTREKVELYSANIAQAKADAPIAFEYDLSRVEEGLYTIHYSFAKTDHKNITQLFYHNPTLRKDPIIGLVDIENLGTTNIDNEENNYLVQFGSPADNT
jgi:hypothetical protein